MTIPPFRARGEVKAIASKSDLHRQLILAALCESPTRIDARGAGEDVLATRECLRALGAEIDLSGDGMLVRPGHLARSARLDAGESASTLRFLMPVAAAVCDSASFTGRGRLPERPIAELMAALSEHGVRFTQNALPFDMRGRLEPGRFMVPCDITSQYATGLMLALPLLDGDSEIAFTGKLNSRAYIDMTLKAMRLYGLEARETAKGFFIPGNQRPVSPGYVCAEGDWSNAAFFLAAGALPGGDVSVTGLNAASMQGDKRVLEYLQSMGARVCIGDNLARVCAGEPAHTRIDLSDTPDLLPPLAVVAACGQGAAFTGVARLRHKESDRLTAICDLVCALGGRAEADRDILTVYGSRLKGGRADGRGDHRIVMAAAISAAGCENEITIDGCEAANKSYPGFFEDLKRIAKAV